ncbi:helix-turn-helix domain-containing protein [Oleisolibacter albus]|uniref:helix-turn-helix domain-containing protein n=1 Tax=Oleisolibacter albus TaxID=2171757 RepID=UPI000DF4C278|nr:helix-turn-helix transcriptional regulator [Oleisolibacter albus]
MSEKKAMLGHKVRRLRRDLKMTQAQMAEELGISASYLNLIEANQRPLTVPLLLKIAGVYGIDMASFAEDDETRLVAGLKEVFADPLFETGDIKNQDMKELAAVAPTLGQAVVQLYRAYREARQDLSALAESMVDGDKVQPGNVQAFPQEDVGEFFQAQLNHFPEVETAAESLWLDADLDSGDLYGSLAAHLHKSHSVRVKLMPVDVMGSAVCRYDRHSRRVLVSEMLPPAARTFHLAAQIGLLKHRDLLQGIVTQGGFSSEDAKRLALIGLSGVFAGAVMMPYGRFLQAARSLRYDVELLMHRFGASFEQVCHRLTALQRPGAKGVPFFFLRIDNAGNISKRFSATPGFHFARFGGACPRWNIHDAFRLPGAIQTQLARLPDGTTYFSIARRVVKPGGGWKRPARQFAIALGTDIAHAGQLVYADGVDLSNLEAATPIGVNCRICPRLDCTLRAFPPLNHRLEADEHIRGITSYVEVGVR